MVGTRLTCHAACFWSPFDQETIRIAWEMDARLSVNEIADRLAVPRSTVWFAVRGKR